MSFRECGIIVVPSIANIRKSVDFNDGDALLRLYFENDHHAAENASCRTLAMTYLTRAVELGHRYARYILACHSAIGRHVRKDLGHARDLFQSDGDPYAGEIFKHISHNHRESFGVGMIQALYAESRIVHGETGALVANGISLLKSGVYTRAFALFHRASEKGNGAACYWLAVMYRRGWGVARDPLRDAMYNYEAARQGYSKSDCLQQ